MRPACSLWALLALAGCSSRESGAPDITTYFDRNRDGTVDRELHDLACCDRNWALVDSDFNGRYDLKVSWGFTLGKSPVDIVVPKSVPISASDPPEWALEIR